MAVNSNAGGGAPPETSTFWAGGNGYGSNNTKIRKFSTEVRTVGTAFTVSNSATDGFSVTINVAGIYSFCLADLANTATVYGLSKNSNQLTTGIVSITAAHALVMLQNNQADSVGTTPWTGWCAVGDVIRPHTQGDPDDVSAARVRFHGVRIA